MVLFLKSLVIASHLSFSALAGMLNLDKKPFSCHRLLTTSDVKPCSEVGGSATLPLSECAELSQTLKEPTSTPTSTKKKHGMCVGFRMAWSLRLNRAMLVSEWLHP